MSTSESNALLSALRGILPKTTRGNQPRPNTSAKPGNPSELSNTEIAAMLQTSPEALAAFQNAYAAFEDASPVAQNLFQVNSRQAAALAQDANSVAGTVSPKQAIDVPSIINEIVAALHHDQAAQNALAASSTQSHRSHHPHQPAIEQSDVSTDAQLLNLIDQLPTAFKPQLTGTHIVRDVDQPAHPALLAALQVAQSQNNPHRREQMMLGVNAMLDTFDLDAVLYAMLSLNPASMSHWLEPLQDAVATTGFFRVPQTTVRPVPLPILQMTRLDYSELTSTTMEIIDQWTREAFALDESKQYFIKTGTYSMKFDFRNCRIQDPQEVREIGRYLTYIQFQANQMASPLNMPGPIAGVSTTNEWVVREWIEDQSNSPSIYHGMPLRTEFRVFVDCDQDTVLAVAPYWDPEVMIERFEQHADSQDPQMRHDAIVFRAHLPVLMERFERLKDTVTSEVHKILPALDLEGQWSLDIMLNDESGDQLYAIDMAPAATSALSHHVPAGLLNALTERQWLPRLGA